MEMCKKRFPKPGVRGSIPFRDAIYLVENKDASPKPVGSTLGAERNERAPKFHEGCTKSHGNSHVFSRSVPASLESTRRISSRLGRTNCAARERERSRRKAQPDAQPREEIGATRTPHDPQPRGGSATHKKPETARDPLRSGVHFTHTGTIRSNGSGCPPSGCVHLPGFRRKRVYSGFPAVLMPRLAFLQRPLRWLGAISRYRATHSGGPDFAYELCIRKVLPEQRKELDLASWKSAYTGGES